MPGLFVTATGTDVGKTYVTAALIRAGRRAGVATGALKPVMTGFRESEAARSDAGHLLDALDQPVTPEAIAAVAPWRFVAPLAPNMAAVAEGVRLDFDAVIATCRSVISSECLVLVEGIGGVMVPLDSRHTVLDLIGAVDIPVLLVTGSALGSLSHCLTACEALDRRGHAPALIVLNESPDTTVPLRDTRDTLAAFCPDTSVMVVTRDAGPEEHDALLRAVLAIPALGWPSRGQRSTA